MAPNVLLDANLAVLLIVGDVDKANIEQHKRLRAFDVQDYELLKRVLTGFGRITCTPNVLTEVSNLIRQSSDPHRTRYMRALALFIDDLDEIHIESSEVAAQPVYSRLGLTDAGLLTLCGRGFHLLTTDFGLFEAVTRANFSATNFTHLQAADNRF